MSVGGAAQAAYVAYLYPQGANVVASGSGSFNKAGLSFRNQAGTIARINPAGSAIGIGGTPNVFVAVDAYGGATAPPNFGAGPNRDADATSGPALIVVGGLVATPIGYQSGTAVGTSTATWNNSTLASLGAAVGTYVWTWGTGATADTFTLIVSASPPPPPPAAPNVASIPTLSEWGVILMSTLLAGLGIRSARRRRPI
ncbi:IPTL-CTERM sorting domain-containing protein [Xylophilus sp. Leaf220]|uniref:IPTL-CTERM sorting domain-containing protein n=1 Tax=Xylophilus sp. Leaf220 TaxID=1735686 RepID=UPI00210161CA|nr:IPTL-CTERM sorting domain-containing protein [Xylophilus sp. Leaf220]